MLFSRLSLRPPLMSAQMAVEHAIPSTFPKLSVIDSVAAIALPQHAAMPPPSSTAVEPDSVIASEDMLLCLRGQSGDARVWLSAPWAGLAVSSAFAPAAGVSAFATANRDDVRAFSFQTYAARL